MLSSRRLKSTHAVHWNFFVLRTVLVCCRHSWHGRSWSHLTQLVPCHQRTCIIIYPESMDMAPETCSDHAHPVRFGAFFVGALPALLRCMVHIACLAVECFAVACFAVACLKKALLSERKTYRWEEIRLGVRHKRGLLVLGILLFLLLTDMVRVCRVYLPCHDLPPKHCAKDQSATSQLQPCIRSRASTGWQTLPKLAWNRQGVQLVSDPSPRLLHVYERNRICLIRRLLGSHSPRCLVLAHCPWSLVALELHDSARQMPHRCELWIPVAGSLVVNPKDHVPDKCNIPVCCLLAVRK